MPGLSNTWQESVAAVRESNQERDREIEHLSSLIKQLMTQVGRDKDKPSAPEEGTTRAIRDLSMQIEAIDDKFEAQRKKAEAIDKKIEKLNTQVEKLPSKPKP